MQDQNFPLITYSKDKTPKEWGQAHGEESDEYHHGSLVTLQAGPVEYGRLQEDKHGVEHFVAAGKGGAEGPVVQEGSENRDQGEH